jgi:hypothetical protein
VPRQLARLICMELDRLFVGYVLLQLPAANQILRVWLRQSILEQPRKEQAGEGALRVQTMVSRYLLTCSNSSISSLRH